MAISTNIACTSCGQIFTIESPDDSYVDHRTIRMDYNWLDFVPMTAKCTRCQQDDLVLWYRPSNNW